MNELQLELIRMSAFDEEGRLLRRLRLDRNAVSPSMNTLPTAELEGGGTLFVFNPFHTFDSELRLALLRYEFIFASENGGTQLAETIVTPARYETKTRLVLPLRGRIYRRRRARFLRASPASKPRSPLRETDRSHR